MILNEGSVGELKHLPAWVEISKLVVCQEHHTKENTTVRAMHDYCLLSFLPNRPCQDPKCVTDVYRSVPQEQHATCEVTTKTSTKNERLTFQKEPIILHPSLDVFFYRSA